jgi:hypothetical protein
MRTRRLIAALGWGASIGALGGLVGLGGAEFRLPLLPHNPSTCGLRGRPCMARYHPYSLFATSAILRPW